MKIRTMLITGFILMSVFIGIVGYASIIMSAGEMEKLLGKEAMKTSESIANDIDSDVEGRIYESHIFSKISSVQDALKKSNSEFDKIPNVTVYMNEKDAEWRKAGRGEITPFMKAILESPLSGEIRRRINLTSGEGGSVFGEIFITNKYGANVAQSGKTSDYRQDDEGWWQAAVYNGSHIGNVVYDESAAIYSIDISTSVTDENNSIIGVIKAVYNIEKIGEIINKHREINSTEDFKIITTDGKIVYSTEEYEPLEYIGNKEYFQKIQGTHGYFFSEDDRSEESAELFAYHRIDTPDIIVVKEINRGEAFRTVENVTYFILVMSIVLIIGAVIMGFVFSETIISPLKKLGEATKKMQSGHFSYVKVKRRDEIGELATAFNDMLKQLKTSKNKVERYTKDLEKMVEHRTGDLDKKVKELEGTKTALLNMMEDSEELNVQLDGAKQELTKNLTKIKELDLKKDEFISIAAHELKTPLTSIHGFSQLLLTESVAKDKTKRDKYLSIIENETKRLSNLVTETLELSRIDLGTIKFIIEEVDTTSVLDDVKREMNIQIQGKGLKSYYEIDKNIPKIYTDKERLIQILMNLINNSVKYTLAGQIKISATRENNYVHFSVQDTGIGISKEHHAKIFQRFYQVDSSYTRQSGGTGLGLSICKEFVNALGGDIWFKSAAGKGSEFHFTLPIKSKEVIGKYGKIADVGGNSAIQQPKRYKRVSKKGRT